jgi:DNA-binding FadR family transcriptional regulator
MDEHSDEILKQLRDIIANLKPNALGQHKLPTERELADILGVQRSTVRERLAALETLGLINRTQGRGTFLSMPQSIFMQFYFEVALQLNYISIDELQQAREMIEREIARLAALYATPESIATLEDALARMIHTHNVDEAVNADYEFHLALAHATQNPVIILIIEGLSVVLRRVLTRRLQMIRMVAGFANRLDVAHKNILEAVRNRDPEQAAEAMEEHFWVWKRESSKVASLYIGEETFG